MNRRQFLKRCAHLAALAGASFFVRAGKLRAEVPQGTPMPAPAADIGVPLSGNRIEIERTYTEWKNILSPQQFWVLRLRGTEAPFSSPLDHEWGKGVYDCAGCDLPVFSSATKYDSKTGWPSFYAPLPDAVAVMTDHELVVPRTEVHCRRCGCHLGHVFDDGPKPTGKRYCINGVALKFVAAK